MFEYRPTPLHPVRLPELKAAGVSLWIKREDLVHDMISGNKWHKLQLNIRQAKADGVAAMISVGGAYSNHLHALAYAAHVQGIKAIGLVRGDRATWRDSPTLQDAQRWGMQLHSVSYGAYRQRHTVQFQQDMQAQFGPAYWVPEGGSNELGILGVAAWAGAFLSGSTWDEIWLPLGTGGTMAGVIQGNTSAAVVVGVPVLPQWQDQMALWSSCQGSSWRIEDAAHCGGYAKTSPELITAMRHFHFKTGIPLEPVYSGKMIYAFDQALRQGRLDGKRVLLIHTGGMQGLRGMVNVCRV